MENKLTISKGNSKIGKIPNISFTPGKSCVPGTPCAKRCYAKQPYVQYPAVRKSWDSNLDLWNNNPNEFKRRILGWFKNNSPREFRWHVGGDCPNNDYFQFVKTVCHSSPTTRFLMFTKRYDMDFSQLPVNLVVILSTWPGLELPKNDTKLPMAWVCTDDRKPDTYYKCPGYCHNCMKCWELAGMVEHIVFDLH